MVVTVSVTAVAFQVKSIINFFCAILKRNFYKVSKKKKVIKITDPCERSQARKTAIKKAVFCFIKANLTIIISNFLYLKWLKSNQNIINEINTKILKLYTNSDFSERLEFIIRKQPVLQQSMPTSTPSPSHPSATTPASEKSTDETSKKLELLNKITEDLKAKTDSQVFQQIVFGDLEARKENFQRNFMPLLATINKSVNDKAEKPDDSGIATAIETHIQRIVTLACKHGLKITKVHIDNERGIIQEVVVGDKDK